MHTENSLRIKNMDKKLYNEVMPYQQEVQKILNNFNKEHKNLWDKIKNENIDGSIKNNIMIAPVLSICAGMIMLSTSPTEVLNKFKDELELLVEHLLKIK